MIKALVFKPLRNTILFLGFLCAHIAAIADNKPSKNSVSELQATGCLQSYTVNVSPALNTNGEYEPDTYYEFCVNVTDFQRPNNNWIEGMIPSFGSGWDTSTITSVGTVPSQIGGGGKWLWAHNVTTADSTVTSWGWFYDALNDGNPGNDWGDDASCCWNFCFKIKTKDPADAGVDANDTQIKFYVLSDQVLGSFGAGGTDCVGDVVPILAASPISCGMVWSASSSDAYCNLNNGAASIDYTGSNAGSITYSWTNYPAETGNVLGSIPQGTYAVTIINGQCSENQNVVVENSNPGTLNALGKDLNCFDGKTVKVWINKPGNLQNGPWTAVWNFNTTLTGDTLFDLEEGKYVVEYSNPEGCKLKDSVTITSPPEITISVVTDSSSCELNNGKATASAMGGKGTLNYAWYKSDNSFLSSGSSTQNNFFAGEYYTEITDSLGCKKKSMFAIGDIPKPMADFTQGKDTVYLDEKTSFINASMPMSGGIASNNWSVIPGTSTYATSNLEHLFTIEGKNTITLITANSRGCKDTLSKDVNVIKRVRIVPELLETNIFTPNGDGINDVLIFKHLEEASENELTIYNRYGTKVYSQVNYKNDWTGDKLHNGTYYYILKRKDKEDLTGSLTLTR